MSSTPFYLDPNPQGSMSIFDQAPALPFLDVTTDYNYPVNNRQAEASFDVASYFQSALDSSMAYVSEGLGSAKTFIADQYTGLRDTAMGAIDSALWRGGMLLAFLLGGVLILIWVLGKSGVIGQTAQLAGAGR